MPTGKNGKSRSRSPSPTGSSSGAGPAGVRTPLLQQGGASSSTAITMPPYTSNAPPQSIEFLLRELTHNINGVFHYINSFDPRSLLILFEVIIEILERPVANLPLSVRKTFRISTSSISLATIVPDVYSMLKEITTNRNKLSAGKKLHVLLTLTAATFFLTSTMLRIISYIVEVEDTTSYPLSVTPTSSAIRFSEIHHPFNFGGMFFYTLGVGCASMGEMLNPLISHHYTTSDMRSAHSVLNHIAQMFSKKLQLSPDALLSGIHFTHPSLLILAAWTSYEFAPGGKIGREDEHPWLKITTAVISIISSFAIFSLHDLDDPFNKDVIEYLSVSLGIVTGTSLFILILMSYHSRFIHQNHSRSNQLLKQLEDQLNAMTDISGTPVSELFGTAEDIIFAQHLVQSVRRQFKGPRINIDNIMRTLIAREFYKARHELAQENLSHATSVLHHEFTRPVRTADIERERAKWHSAVLARSRALEATKQDRHDLQRLSASLQHQEQELNKAQAKQTSYTENLEREAARHFPDRLDVSIEVPIFVRKWNQFLNWQQIDSIRTLSEQTIGQNRRRLENVNTRITALEEGVRDTQAAVRDKQIEVLKIPRLSTDSAIENPQAVLRSVERLMGVAEEATQIMILNCMFRVIMNDNLARMESALSDLNTHITSSDDLDHISRWANQYIDTR